MQENFKVSLQGNSYSTKITMGKMRDYELNKLVFSNGFYGSISDQFTLDIIDCLSALYAFFPDIKKDQKIQSPDDLGPSQISELIEAMEPFFSWYSGWREKMSKISKVDPKKSDESVS